MKSAILSSPRNLILKEIQTPLTPRTDEVIIRVKYAAICGTDIHVYRGETPAKYPVVLGHEYAGEILIAGSNVKKFKPGDRVVGSYLVSCGKCRFCIIGKSHLCENRLMFGINIDGSFSEYMRIPLAERVLVKVPDEINLRDAVLIPDTFLTALNALEIGQVKPGENLLITGLGSIGLSTIIAAKIIGVNEIIGTVRRERPAKIALELGVKHLVNTENEKALDKILYLTDGYGVDLAIEASGSLRGIKLAFESLKPGGRMIQVAIPSEMINLDLRYMVGMEKTVIGALNPGNTVQIERAFKISVNSINNLRKIVTHEYNLDEIHEAIEVVDKRIGDPVKVLIKIN